MESSNLHNHQHHELQDQLVGSSPSLQNPSFYGVGTTHAWTPSTTLNSGNLEPHIIINSNSRGSRQLQNDILVPPLNMSPMIQDLGLHWDSNKGTFTNLNSNNDLQHHLHLGRVKEELTLSDSYTKMINSTSNIEDFHLNPTTSYLKNEHINLNDLSDQEKLLLRNFSSSAGEYYFNAQQNYHIHSSRGNFSQIFPTVNISDLNQSISRPLDMNLEALDLFNSSRLCGNNYLSQQPQKHVGLLKESLSNYGIQDHIMHQPTHRPSNTPSKISPFKNGVAEAKRPSSLLESKAPQAATKKPRVESRGAPCPPFKVRKEKLGDRIAALQQMVAPFGKTDTASVLMEAIGYIKFLQNQVETLSVPYMKSSSNKASRTMKGGSSVDGSEEPTRDLRSRGLCLVPLSCLSYVTDTGGIWSPPNFGAGT